MGEAKRRRQSLVEHAGEAFRGMVVLQWLPPDRKVSHALVERISEETEVSTGTQILLNAFRATVGQRSFHVGFCIGDGERFSAVGVAVLERLAVECPGATLNVVPVTTKEIAWDIVMRHLRTFTGEALLFAFPDSEIYDAGTAEKHYSKFIEMRNQDGVRIERLSEKDRRSVRKQIAELQGKPTSAMHDVSDIALQDHQWIFRIKTPSGKELRVAVWNGRKDYIHELPDDCVTWVGGQKIAIVQVHTPVGVNRRSSFDLTNKLAADFDGIIHWARDTEVFQSIVNSFLRLDLESVGPPVVPEGWAPEVTIFAANNAADD